MKMQDTELSFTIQNEILRTDGYKLPACIAIRIETRKHKIMTLKYQEKRSHADIHQDLNISSFNIDINSGTKRGVIFWTMQHHRIPSTCGNI